MTTVISIQARMGSTRLPAKVLYPIGDKSILEWTVTRSEKAEFSDEVVVAVGDDDLNKGIIVWCKRLEFEYVIGPEENLLERHLNSVEAIDADTLVRVMADSPFIPSSEIDRLISEHESNNANYTTNFTEDMPRGAIVDVVDADVLETLSNQGETHPVIPLRENPNQYTVQYSTNPEWADISDAQLEVNTSEEYYAIVDAYEAVGSNAHEIGKWLLENP